MKKRIVLFFAISAFVTFHTNAQTKDEEESKGGFKKENLFVGGNVALGFGSGTTSFGLGPYFGYSINKYIDAAISINYNYVSQRDYYTPTKYRQSIIGPGAFVRIFPVKFLFAQAQFEQNFIQQKIIYGGGVPDDKQHVNVSSFLIGPGYASGRGEGKSFYYISVLFDVLKKPNSPYVDNYGRINPIIRAGFNIALFQGKGNNN
ncbi:MAG: hypothetical protein ABJA37_05515 [Ferruginibacter sp.]